jgi:hypothetical protein
MVWRSLTQSTGAHAIDGPTGSRRRGSPRPQGWQLGTERAVLRREGMADLDPQERQRHVLAVGLIAVECVDPTAAADGLGDVLVRGAQSQVPPRTEPDEVPGSHGFRHLHAERHAIREAVRRLGQRPMICLTRALVASPMEGSSLRARVRATSIESQAC